MASNTLNSEYTGSYTTNTAEYQLHSNILSCFQYSPTYVRIDSVIKLD